MHCSPESALEVLARIPGQSFAELFRHGTLSLEIYCPKNTDLQKPHTRDEVYIVINGRGVFVRGDERVSFGPGDFLFVPARIEHRFESFSSDFKTWVLFYGPEGGEAP